MTTATRDGVTIGSYTVAYEPATLDDGTATGTPWVVLDDEGDAIDEFRTKAQAVRAATARHLDATRNRLADLAYRVKDLARLEAALALLEQG